eukprot:Pgem_evm1s19214
MKYLFLNGFTLLLAGTAVLALPITEELTPNVNSVNYKAVNQLKLEHFLQLSKEDQNKLIGTFENVIKDYAEEVEAENADDQSETLKNIQSGDFFNQLDQEQDFNVLLLKTIFQREQLLHQDIALNNYQSILSQTGYKIELKSTSTNIEARTRRSNWFSNAISDVKDWGNKAMSDVADTFSDVGDWSKEQFGKIFDNTAPTISNNINTVTIIANGDTVFHDNINALEQALVEFKNEGKVNLTNAISAALMLEAIPTSSVHSSSSPVESTRQRRMLSTLVKGLYKTADEVAEVGVRNGDEAAVIGARNLDTAATTIAKKEKYRSIAKNWMQKTLGRDQIKLFHEAEHAVQVVKEADLKGSALALHDLKYMKKSTIDTVPLGEVDVVSLERMFKHMDGIEYKYYMDKFGEEATGERLTLMMNKVARTPLTMPGQARPKPDWQYILKGTATEPEYKKFINVLQQLQETVIKNNVQLTGEFDPILITHVTLNPSMKKFLAPETLDQIETLKQIEPLRQMLKNL